ncbi:MAG: 3'-5' exonuclease [Salinivirgaceae bacterium]|nr:3'-5' exonuclease [Salinivirgaceae bacterium]MDD4746805.1 3'-5' exonuclease [Salinivirgaceae bacterium]MDY0280279.1 3'-5' exonuclease [Salinivirgaceae bacterium]
MDINLKRPLIFFDLETTGIDVATDRIVEIALLKIFPDGREETYEKRINPGMPIPPETTEIHHITDADVVNAPVFKEVAKEIARFIEGCDLAGYNSNKFDVPLLAEELMRAEVDFDLRKCKFVDVQNIFHKMEKRTLAAAYKFYCNQDLVNAHSAMADTRATYEILKAQLDRYQNVPYEDNKGNTSIEVVNDVNALSEFTAHTKNVDLMGRVVFNEQGVPVFNFGKYKGTSVLEVFDKDPGYYGWILNGNFPAFTKKVLTEIKLSRFQK